MPKVRRSLHVPFSPAQIFDLVVDIENYPRFVPGWRSVRILSKARNIDGDPDRGQLVVDQKVSEKGLRFRFQTEARYRKPSYIRIATTSAPYRYFMLIWHFASDGQGGCRVQVYTRYRLRAVPLQYLAERHFNRLLDDVIRSFEREARRRYGSRQTGRRVGR